MALLRMPCTNASCLAILWAGRARDSCGCCRQGISSSSSSLISITGGDLKDIIFNLKWREVKLST
ncbi:MAG: hypothetical protein AAFR83_26815 [Cyanobacteria bacterium J06629_18]